MLVDVNKSHYLYFMHLYIYLSEKGSVGFTRFFTGVHGTNKVKNPGSSRWEKCRMLRVEAGSGYSARSVRNDTHGECMFISKFKNCSICWPSWSARYVHTTNPFISIFLNVSFGMPSIGCTLNSSL